MECSTKISRGVTHLLALSSEWNRIIIAMLSHIRVIYCLLLFPNLFVIGLITISVNDII